MTLVVIASEVDDAARDLTDRLSAHDAALLCPRDLSRPGWCVDTSRLDESRCVVAGGRVVASRDLHGVVILLPYVIDKELVHIDEEDRAYVASEMTAFLVFWLNTLACPILNTPSAGCLAGPAWRPERWRVEARAVRLPLRTHARSAQMNDDASPIVDEPDEIVTLTIAGDECIDDGREALDALRDPALALAQRAGCGLLVVRFARSGDDYAFAGATPLPQGGPLPAEAISRFFARIPAGSTA